MKTVKSVLLVVILICFSSSLRAALIHDIQLLDGTSVGQLVLSQEVCSGAVGADICTSLVTSMTIEVGGVTYNSIINDLFINEPFYSHWQVDSNWLLTESSFSFGEGNNLGVLINTTQHLGLNLAPGEFIFAAGRNDLAQYVGGITYRFVPVHDIPEPSALLLIWGSCLLLLRRKVK